MPKKTESVIQLAVHTARQITTNSANYMAFLTTAAHNFKYNFRCQRQCDFVVYCRTSNVRKWRVNLYSL